MVLRVFLLALILPALWAGTRGELVCDKQGHFLFSYGDPESARATILRRVLPDGRVQEVYRTKDERSDLLLATDREGGVFVAETRDYKRWDEWEVTIWEALRDGTRRTLWPTWRKRDNLAAFIPDGAGGFYWSHDGIVFHRDKSNKTQIVVGIKQGNAQSERVGYRLGSVTALSWTAKGKLVILDGDALYRLEAPNVLKRLWHQPNSGGKDLAVSRDGRFWVVGGSGLMCVTADGTAVHVFKSERSWELLAVTSHRDRIFLLEQRDRQVRLSEWKRENVADLIFKGEIED